VPCGIGVYQAGFSVATHPSPSGFNDECDPRKIGFSLGSIHDPGEPDLVGTIQLDMCALAGLLLMVRRYQPSLAACHIPKPYPVLPWETRGAKNL
jgi:hypothetical protein